MTEKRKNKKKKEVEAKAGDDKPTKEEYAVAKYLKDKLPEKKTTLLGHKVEYFIGNKAVDLLVESPWAKANKKGDLNFSNRGTAIDFMQKLLEHKFFHRAKKIFVQKDQKKSKKKDADDAQDSDSDGKDKEEKDSDKVKEKESDKVKEKKSDKVKEKDSDKVKEKDSDKGKETEKSKESKKSKKKVDDVPDKVEEEKSKDKKKVSEVSERKKVKKKVKLDMHLEQLFIDTNEPYVWIYDPIPLRTWVTGALMVVAAVALCLFPLWPQGIRNYIYYLSVAAAFLLVVIIGLAVLRLVVFVIVWVFTFGKHHLWLLPNLTEDVGFFASFWPLYHYEYKGSVKQKDKKPKKHKHSDSDEKDHKDEEEEEKNSKEADKEPSEKGSESEDKDSRERDSDSEGQPKTDNGFEFLEAEEVSEEEDPSQDEEEEDRKTK